MEAHGWRLFVHPLFQAQLETLAKRVEKLAAADPDGYVSHPATKMLATINRFIRDLIPRDPNSPEFRQGNTLGPDNRHWFRAKFHGRYRLFYRFSTEQKIIVYAWVNDEGSLRKSGAKTDPYVLFKAMLESGEPPSSFAELMRNATEMQ
jgi:toxin YhaV